MLIMSLCQPQMEAATQCTKHTSLMSSHKQPPTVYNHRRNTGSTLSSTVEMIMTCPVGTSTLLGALHMGGGGTTFLTSSTLGQPTYIKESMATPTISSRCFYNSLGKGNPRGKVIACQGFLGGG